MSISCRCSIMFGTSCTVRCRCRFLFRSWLMLVLSGTRHLGVGDASCNGRHALQCLRNCVQKPRHRELILAGALVPSTYRHHSWGRKCLILGSACNPTQSTILYRATSGQGPSNGDSCDYDGISIDIDIDINVLRQTSS